MGAMAVLLYLIVPAGTAEQVAQSRIFARNLAFSAGELAAIEAILAG